MFKLGKIDDTELGAFTVNYLIKTKMFSIYKFKNAYLGFGLINFHNSYYKFNTSVFVLKNLNFAIRFNW